MNEIKVIVKQRKFFLLFVLVLLFFSGCNQLNENEINSKLEKKAGEEKEFLSKSITGQLVKVEKGKIYIQSGLGVYQFLIGDDVVIDLIDQGRVVGNFSGEVLDKLVLTPNNVEIDYTVLQDSAWARKVVINLSSGIEAKVVNIDYENSTIDLESKHSKYSIDLKSDQTILDSDFSEKTILDIDAGETIGLYLGFNWTENNFYLKRIIINEQQL